MSVWTVLLIVLAALLAAIAASVFLPTRIDLVGYYKTGEFGYGVSIKLPIIPWYIRVDPAKWYERKSSAKASPRKQAAQQSAESISSQITQARRVFRLFSKFRPEIKKMVRKMAESTTVLDLDIDAILGVDDAAASALLVGAARSAAAVGLTLARQIGVKFKKRPSVSIRPLFDRVHVSAGFTVSVAVVPFSSMISAYGMYRIYRKNKKPVKRHESRATRNSAAHF